ncbi:MAG TPA: RNA polymerase factor sigma-54 [Bacteroidia bacterium]|nr:RNA polymerase factor sigma-54 [Bacteroidia bacterium]
MLKQGFQQRLLQKLSPQQIQLMKLLQVPAAALEQRIKEELEINPALEEGMDEEEQELQNEEDSLEDIEEKDEEEVKDFETDFDADSGDDQRKDDFDIDEYMVDEDVPYYKTNVNNTSPDEERTEIPISALGSFQENQIAQLGICELDDRTYQVGLQLIGSLDDDGYLRRDLDAIVDDLAFSQNVTATKEELLEVLKVIQTFDPAGVGARDLQECLMLQLERKDEHDKIAVIAKRIVREYMDEFSKKHYTKIASALNLDDEHLKDAIHEILKLNPRPGSNFAIDSKSSEAVIPDFLIANNDGILDLSLNSKNAPDLHLSKAYMEMLQTYSKDKTHKKTNREALTFVKQKVDAAKWFIDAIQQRQFTLMNTMSAIMNYQKEYFLEGDEKLLKPMILKDIAEIVGLDISTVSRVANSKYVQTPFGTFLLKTFFSEGMSTEAGEEVSSREVKKILSDAISNEDKMKPLPDDKLAKLLKDKGYNIARRTIAKYREQLNIPVARLRKEL